MTSKDAPNKTEAPKKGSLLRRWIPVLFSFVLGALVAGGFAYNRAFLNIGTAANEIAGHEAHAKALVESNGKSNQGRKVLYWVDPMNPTMRSDKPGKAPCGMDLVPVYEEAAQPVETPAAPGAITLSTEKQQLSGVEYGEVREHALSKTLRTVGRVTYDETKLAHVHTKFSGWIDKVYVDFTGKLVKKGQPLASVYSPELVSTQQELLIARRSKNLLQDSPYESVGSGAVSLYDSTRERLRLWDISDAQVKEIERRGTPIKALTLHSSINGYVLKRDIFSGQQVGPETELYTIADLSSVWVLADIYEYEVPLIKLGQEATMSLSYYPGKTFKGKVTYIYPELDQTTRTLKVRIEFSNADLQLKPDMYTNVSLNIDFGRKLAVPHEAVLDSGTSKTVFVAGPNGTFEPRKISVGERVDDLFVVLDGLKAGERVVTSANFLIDSESQLKSATAGMAGGAHAGHGGGVPEKNKPDDLKEKSSSPKERKPVDHSEHDKKETGAVSGRPSLDAKPAPQKGDHSGH